MGRTTAIPAECTHAAAASAERIRRTTGYTLPRAAAPRCLGDVSGKTAQGFPQAQGQRRARRKPADGSRHEVLLSQVRGVVAA